MSWTFSGRFGPYLAVTFAVALAGCSEDDTQRVLTRITVAPDSAALVVGDTEQLTAFGHYDDGFVEDLSERVTWSSSDTAIATLDDKGLVTALAAGTTTIVAADGSISSEAVTVTVSAEEPEPVLTAIRVVPGSALLRTGMTLQYVALGDYDDDTTRNLSAQVTWASSDTDVASIDATGLLASLAAGTTQITASLGDEVSAPATVEVQDRMLVTISIDPATVTLYAGSALTEQLAAEGTFDDGTKSDVTKAVTWTSSDEDVASVDSEGLVSAGDQPGTVIVTATLGEVESSIVVTVLPSATVTALEISGPATDVVAGLTLQLTAKATFEDGRVVDVTGDAVWASDPAATASVGEEGLVTGLVAGPVEISATFDGKSDTYDVTVGAAIVESLAIAPAAPQGLPVGMEQPFTVEATYTDGTKADLTADAGLVWSSSAPAVATISNAAGSKGLATAISSGGTLIGAAYGDVHAPAVLLSVVPALVEAIEIDPVDATVPAGSVQPFLATGTFSDGSSGDVTHIVVWSSSDTTVAGIDAHGQAATLKPGSVTIKAKLGTLETTATLVVTTAVLAELQIDPTAPAALPVGLQQPFTATGIFTDGSNADLTTSPYLTWSSSIPAVAVIDAAGKATAQFAGGTEIGAAYDDGTTEVAAPSVTLTVIPALLTSIQVTPAAPTVPQGFDVAFRATGLYSDGSVQDITASVTWQSLSPSVAMVSAVPGEEGLVTGLAAGNAVIKASAAGLSAQTTLRVSSAKLVSISTDPPVVDVAPGLTRAFHATGNFDDGSTMTVTNLVTWAVHPADLGRGVTISNATGRQGLATVSGSATPSPAPVTILAAYGGVAGIAELTIVGPVTLVGIVVDVTDNILPVGLTVQATAQGLYSDGVHPPTASDITNLVTWSPDVSGIATVSNAAGSKGRVTGVAQGVVSINACLGAVCANDPGGPGSPAVIAVTACGFDEITIRPNSNPARQLPRGTARQYRAFASYRTTGGLGCFLLGGAEFDVTELATWWSSNALIASVSNAAGERGLVRAADVPPDNTALITARYETFEDELPLTVIDACVSEITLGGVPASMPAGVRQQLTATALLTDGSTIDFTELAGWQVTGGLALVDDGLIQSFPAPAGTVTASSAATTQCAAVSETATIAINDAVITSIEVTPHDAEVAIGSSVELTATGRFSNGTWYDMTDVATWVSSNPSVAAATPGGTISGLSVGRVVILATVGTVSGTADVNVGGLELSTITVSAEPLYACGTFGGAGYPLMAQVPLRAIGTWSDGSTNDLTALVTWSSTTNKVSMSAGGVATMALAGTATIKAEMDGVEGTMPVTVLASTLQSLQIVPGDGFAIPVNASLQFRATGFFTAVVGSATLTDECNMTKQVTWTAAPGASLAIDSNGLATTTATPSASATITATKNAVVKTATGVVSGACVQGIAINPTSATTAIGILKQLTATAILSDGSTFGINFHPMTAWSSTNPAVATVFGGMIIPNAAGVANISLLFNAGPGACQGVGPILTTSIPLVVNPSALTDITVTCDNAGQLWPGPSGLVPGLPAGIRTQCHALGHYSNGTSSSITDSVQWTSSAPAVANIGDAAGTKGQVLTLTPGMAAIGAHLGGVSGSLSVRVVGATLTRIDVSGQSPLPVGFSDDYTALGRFTLGPISRFFDVTDLATWTSSKPAVATVSDAQGEKGLVRTVAPSGLSPAMIQASYLGLNGSRALFVLAVTLEEIEVAPEHGTLALGQSRQYAANGIYRDGFGGVWTRDITTAASWYTTDPAIASVGPTGMVFSHGLGDVAIVAELAAASGSADLTVEDKCIQSVELIPTSVSLPAGVPLQFEVTARFSSGPPADITSDVLFTSSDLGRMDAPDHEGRSFTKVGAAPGVVTIRATATSGGCSGMPFATATVVVNDAVLEAIAVYGAPPSVPVGLTTPFVAVGQYSDGSSYDITETVDSWDTGSTAVATVSNVPGDKGTVLGIGLGSTPVIATQEAISGSSPVGVSQATLVAIDVVGFDTRNVCRSLTDPAAWVNGNWRHPGGAFTTWAKAIGTFSDGSQADLTESVTWASAIPARASVSNAAGTRGQVRTGTAGVVAITASMGGLSDALDLTVGGATLDLLYINPAGPDPVKLALGNEHQLALVGRFDGAMYCVTEDAVWSTSDGMKVTVNNAAGDRGQLQTHALGNVIVTAFIGSVNDTIGVQVASPTLDSISIVPAALELVPGATGQLTAIAHFSDGSVNDVTWAGATTWFTSNPGVAALTATKGLIRAAGLGAADIDVCMHGVCAHDSDEEAEITVVAP